jgi:hypothetical protein
LKQLGHTGFLPDRDGFSRGGVRSGRLKARYLGRILIKVIGNITL